MIVTKNWLQEWIDLGDVAIDDLVKKLNKIGLEVAEVRKIEVPQNVVVGRVVSCAKHPDADKLSVCEVDIGSERLQIVCGAQNAKDAEFVAIAKVGAKLPNGLEIKPVKLRGVESHGMLCASSELGLPKTEDGIALLDPSIGELEVGKELRFYELFDDYLIDIELTANRGDCLSVLGIARELATAYGKKLKKIELQEDNAIKIGIGRLLQFNIADEIESSVIYKAFKAKSLKLPYLLRFRLGLVEESFECEAEGLGYYIAHSTGVIARVFGYRFFQEESSAITLKKDEKGFDAVYGKKKGAIIGLIQFNEAKPQKDEEDYIVQFSYIDPVSISKKLYENENKIKSDWEFYRSSRGSEPRLQIGLDFTKYLLNQYFDNVSLYAGRHESIKEIEKPALKIDFDSIDAIVGQAVDRNTIVEILKALEFEIVSLSEEALVVKTPVFRHDIVNVQDVVEEIVRIYGIDNIAAKPLCFVEKRRLNEAYEIYRKKRAIKDFAIAAGYFETISFIFTQKSILKRYGFEVVQDDIDLLNPITAELDTLRTSLVPNLLEQAIKNVRNGKKRVKLFEIGTIFDSNRNEKEAIALIFSGQKEPQSVLNSGKPEFVGFADMVEDLARIIGHFELQRCEPKNSLMHPYQSATILKNGVEVGYLYKLTLPLQEELDLYPTYIAELDFDKVDMEYPKAKEFSQFQLSLKDLSFLVDKDMDYTRLKELFADLPQEVKRFYPIDIYEDEKLGDKKSLTIRFAIQSDEKTLTEDEISGIMDTIIHKASSLGATLR